MLPAVALLPVGDLLVGLLVVAGHLGVLPVVLVAQAVVDLLVGLLVLCYVYGLCLPLRTYLLADKWLIV